MQEADIITGARNRAALPQLVKDFSLDHQRVVNIPKHEKGEDFESCSAADFGVRTRAFLKIQDGCDNWCSYCIIPAARPSAASPCRSCKANFSPLRRTVTVRSSSPASIFPITAGNGGCTSPMPSWRQPPPPASSGSVSGSIEPDLLTPQEIYRLAEGCGGKLCPQFHLSLQSGCDATLRRMNRHYDTTQYRAVAEAVRKAFSGAALTTDMMVGFAGETEVDHQESLQFAREIGFAKIHAFATASVPAPAPPPCRIRSPRPIKSAAAELIAVAAELRKTALTAMLGQTQLVLFEPRAAGLHRLHPHYYPVTVCDPAAHPGDIRPVLLTAIAPDADGCEGILYRLIFGETFHLPAKSCFGYNPLSKFLPTAKYALRAAAKGSSAGLPQAPSSDGAPCGRLANSHTCLKPRKEPPMTLLYLITAIFTMLSLVLSVRRVPALLPCCRRSPLPAPLPCSSITSLNNKGVPMLFRPAAESDLDAIERHYTELLTHEAETGRSTTNWSLGVYPTRQTAAAALARRHAVGAGREGEPSPASSSIITRMISMPPLVGSIPPRRSKCLWSIPSASRPGMPGRALAENASPASAAGRHHGLHRHPAGYLGRQYSCRHPVPEKWFFALWSRPGAFQGKIPEELVFLEYRCPPSADPRGLRLKCPDRVAP